MSGCDPIWLQRAVARLDLLLREEPEIAALLAPLLARLGGEAAATSLRSAFCRVLSTPFLRLLQLLTADLGLAQDDPRAEALGRATAWLYLYVRLQDDLVDEPAITPAASVFVMERLLALHLDAFVEAAPSPAALRRRSRQMGRFARVMAAEALARDGGAGTAGRGSFPGGDLGWMGEKFLPAAVALCALAGEVRGEQAADAVEAVVLRLGVAWQLVNDAHDVARDAAAGRLTPLGARCAARGEPQTAAGLVAGQALPLAIAEVQAEIAAARTIAAEAGLAGLGGVIDDAEERLRLLPSRLMAEVLGLPPA